MIRLKNGIYATAMNNRIMKAYEEIEDEDMAISLLEAWFMEGVPDGNDLIDNINDFGTGKEFDELVDVFFDICERYDIERKVFYEEVEEIKKNIVEMLDNPYYNMV